MSVNPRDYQKLSYWNQRIYGVFKSAREARLKKEFKAVVEEMRELIDDLRFAFNSVKIGKKAYRRRANAFSDSFSSGADRWKCSECGDLNPLYNVIIDLQDENRKLKDEIGELRRSVARLSA